METLNAVEDIRKAEPAVATDSQLLPKANIAPTIIDHNCPENGVVNIGIKGHGENSNADKCENSDGASEKENDGWEVVEGSSDESEKSDNGNFDIIIPLKIIETSECNVPSIKAGATSNKDTKDVENINAITVDQDIQKDNETTKHDEPVVNKIQNTQTHTVKVKRRKKQLHTGDSDEEMVLKESENSRTVTERENKANEEVQNPHAVGRKNGNSVETYQSVSKHNATFTKENPIKLHPDTDVTKHDYLMQMKKMNPSSSKSSKLRDITEMDSDEDIIEVPCSPKALNSTYHMIPSRQKPHNRDNGSHMHDSHCNFQNSRRAKRQKIMQHMWEERERKIKQKMVKKIETIFYKVLESIVSSSDESEQSSLSDDEDNQASKMLRRRGQQCNKQCCSLSQRNENNETENIRDLKRELKYWKSKAKETETLSQREVQIQEIKEDLNYWKHLATSKSAPHSSSPHYNLQRTSTPEKVEDMIPEMSMSKPHEISRVTSSADIIPYTPCNAVLPKTNDHTNEGVWFSTQDKHKNPFSRETYRPSASKEASRALNVVSRTKFTEKEKNQIVKYLVSHYDELELLRGNSFWMQMAHALDTYRSWHSLKNNFFTNIIKNLEQYEMPSKVRNKIIGLAKQYI